MTIKNNSSEIVKTLPLWMQVYILCSNSPIKTVVDGKVVHHEKR